MGRRAFPLSYGLLYGHDDEHAILNNEFVVYRIAHGKMTEFADSRPSPFQPTVEMPYVPRPLD